MSRNLIIFFIIVALVAGGAGWWYGQRQAENPAVTQPQTVAVNVIIDHQDRADTNKTIEVASDTTALDATKQAATIEQSGTDENAFVNSIDGVVADQAQRQFWSLYINNTLAEVGAGAYRVKNGDTITWKLDTF